MYESSLQPPHELIQATLIGEAIDPGPAAVFVADEQMRYVAVNDFACRMLGYSREDLLALRVTDVARDDRTADDYAEMIGRGSWNGTARMRRKDGSELTLHFRARETSVARMTVWVAVGWPEDDELRP